MHPVVVIVPIAALAFLPGLWARQLLKVHNARELEELPQGHELARQLLDRQGLEGVRVECTDVGDHYDPRTRAVRLSRDKYGRRSLAAVTTAAHEAAHAMQDAAGYPPFVWRTRLVSLSQVTGRVGTSVLIAVPLAALMTRQPVPPLLIGGALAAMLGSGLAAQLAALPTELDASFGRALPLLRAGYLDAEQARAARQILIAGSATYVAASLLSVLHVWPWAGVPRAPVPLRSGLLHRTTAGRPASSPRAVQPRGARLRPAGSLAATLRLVGKPLIRGWFQLSRRLNV